MSFLKSFLKSTTWCGLAFEGMYADVTTIEPPLMSEISMEMFSISAVFECGSNLCLMFLLMIMATPPPLEPSLSSLCVMNAG